jgi:hypothetical protein
MITLVAILGFVLGYLICLYDMNRLAIKAGRTLREKLSDQDQHFHTTD